MLGRLLRTDSRPRQIAETHGRSPGIKSELIRAVILQLDASQIPAQDSPTGTPQGVAHSTIERLVLLVDDVIVQLETPTGHLPPGELLAECNAVLEACLAFLRDVGDHDDIVCTAIGDLHRLGRILKLVDGRDVPFVMRQIRRVLGRFDGDG